MYDKFQEKDASKILFSIIGKVILPLIDHTEIEHLNNSELR